jgi:hemoglobin
MWAGMPSRHDAPQNDEDRPMTHAARSFRRAQARTGVALLPLLPLLPLMLAGCSVLFPARRGIDGPRTPSVATAPSASAPAPARSAKAAATLYSRLGGDAGVNAFTDDFLGRVTNDPAIIPFFKGLTPADLQRIRQHVYELLCSVTGGGCTYSGKDMKTVHQDMEINNDAWNAFTGHLNESVARFHVADRERNELVVIVQSLKKDIVNR